MYYLQKMPGSNEYFVHLTVKRYTHTVLKKLKILLKEKLKEYNYPTLFTYTPKHKQKLAEQVGFKFIRYHLRKDGVYSFLYLEGKNYVN